MFYTGSARHALDAKGRVFVPAKFRARLADGLVVAPAPDRTLWVFAKEDWPDFVRRLNEKRRAGEVSAGIERTITGNAEEDVPDQQGRFLIPPTLRKHANLTKDLWFRSLGDRLEIVEGERGDRENESGFDELANARDLPL